VRSIVDGQKTCWPVHRVELRGIAQAYQMVFQDPMAFRSTRARGWSTLIAQGPIVHAKTPIRPVERAATAELVEAVARRRERFPHESRVPTPAHRQSPAPWAMEPPS